MKETLRKALAAIGSGLAFVFKAIPFEKLKEKGSVKWILACCILLLFVFIAWGLYVGREPKTFDVRSVVAQRLLENGRPQVVGATTVVTLIHVAETLQNKPGGYQSNDVMPPTVFMDNIPNWEFGVLTQVRDMTRSLRNDISRSRSQSAELKELQEAEPLFNINNASWAFPSSESKYRDGVEQLDQYLKLLASQSQTDAQFYARADNLRDWLMLVEKRLSSLSQRLAASVGSERVNTDLAGDSAAEQSTYTTSEVRVRTPWLEIDDVFYEARGTTWALLHLLQAVEQDFGSVLEKKNARALLRQIIREMEGAQRSVYSPMILNGGGFGFTANHSLVMASYISRANTAIIELRDLLSQG